MSSTTDHDRFGSLNQLLADYQVFYQKLRTYHWTVRGPMFFDLHLKFEELYLDAAIKVDEIAERVLAIGGAVLCVAMLVNNLAVLQEVYREFSAGLEVERRDATGALIER